jgi:hypothetical protein
MGEKIISFFVLPFQLSPVNVLKLGKAFFSKRMKYPTGKVPSGQVLRKMTGED